MLPVSGHIRQAGSQDLPPGRFPFVRVGDVSSHHSEVMPVEQQLPEQLERLPPGHVVVRVQQLLVVQEHLVEVRVEEVRSQQLVFRQ